MELLQNRYKRKYLLLSIIIACILHFMVILFYWQNIKKDIVEDYIPTTVEIPKPKSLPVPQFQFHDGFGPLQMPEGQKFDVSRPHIAPLRYKMPAFKDITGPALIDPSIYRSPGPGSAVESQAVVDAQIQDATIKALDMAGVRDLVDDGRSFYVRGSGKRMKARITLCLLATPGASIVGESGSNRTTGGDATPTALGSSSSTVKWNYLFNKYHILQRLHEWFADNTKITITQHTRTLNMSYTFSDWVSTVRKNGPGNPLKRSDNLFPIIVQKLENALNELFANPVSGKQSFCRKIKETMVFYLKKQHQIDVDNTLSFSIDSLNNAEPWCLRSINKTVSHIKSLSADQSEYRLIKSIKSLYIHLKKEEALLNPIILISNTVGLEKVHSENIIVLENYIKNGGFIWIDDTGVATQHINNQDRLARVFIRNLLAFDDNRKLSELEKSVFDSLSSSDRKVPGFEFGQPFPPYAHPKVFLPVNLPRFANMDVHVYNSHGVEVVSMHYPDLVAGHYTSFERALVWPCMDGNGTYVSSGPYFIRIESGIFRQTRLSWVSKLRQLDMNHPLMSSVYNFKEIPRCILDNGSSYWVSRPYGSTAYGYNYRDKMVLLYTEGAGIIAGAGFKTNSVIRHVASRFFHNVLGYCLANMQN
jgi:hypothetical protein